VEENTRNHVNGYYVLPNTLAINLPFFLFLVEINFNRASKALKENWRKVTKRNVEMWFSLEE